MSEAGVYSPEIIVERTGMTMWITMNRPHALNAMTRDMAGMIDETLIAAADDDTVRCVAITGTGRAFCVGADLKSNATASPGARNEATLDFIRFYNKVLNRVESFPKPLFAVINGMTLGAGIELALCCDAIFASDQAKIGDGHAKFGLIPGGGGSVRLPQRIGPSAAKLLMYTGDFLDAKRCLDIGLIDRLLSDVTLRADSQQIFDKISCRSPRAMRVMKELVNDAISGDVTTGLAREFDAVCDHMNSADRAEGLAAFAQKRQPQFTGH